MSAIASSITSRLRRPRKSIFRRPSASTSCIANWVTTSWSRALLLERDVLDERPVADDDSRGVDRVLPDEALERLREVDDLAHHLVRVVRLPQLGAGLQAVVEIDLRALGDRLRNLVDDAVRDVEHPPGVTNGRPRGHRPEGDDLRDPIAAVLLGHVVDDLVASVRPRSRCRCRASTCDRGSGSARRAGRSEAGRCR